MLSKLHTHFIKKWTNAAGRANYGTFQVITKGFP